LNRQTAVPHTEHGVDSPKRLANGFSRPVWLAEITADKHVLPHRRFRTACVRFDTVKGALQRSQIFQNGYARFVFLCGIFCKLKCFHSAAFNDATVISADDLLPKISDNSVGGILVVIFHYVQDRLQAVGPCGYVVTNYEVPWIQFRVRFDPVRRSDLSYSIQTSEHPLQAVPNLEPRILDRTDKPVIGAGASEDDHVGARVQHVPHPTPGLRLERHVAPIPRLPHESLGQPVVLVVLRM
jgi:hypothetical protein